MKANEKFAILPYQGAGSIRFGMSPSEIKGLIGAPDQVSTNHLKQRVEFRSFMNVAYTPSMDQHSVLTHIGFGRQMEMVLIEDVNLFKDDPIGVLNRLMLVDSRPMTYLGFVVFFELGIALTGFHDNDVSQKAVTVFEKGAWDNRVPKMNPFEEVMGSRAMLRT